MNIKFVWSEPSTKRGVVKAIISLLLIFGIDVPEGYESQILGGLLALESVIGMFLSDKKEEKNDV